MNRSAHIAVTTATTTARNRQSNALYYFRIKSSPIMQHAFTTGGRGSRIVNAITGDSYYSHHTVGSAYEMDYFRVRIPGAFSKWQAPCDLYYDSPDEFEAHFQTKLNATTKKIWQDEHRNANKTLIQTHL